MKVLIVDDESSIRELVSDLFLSVGYEVKTECTVKDAAAVLEKEKFDALWTDDITPGGMRGMELLERCCRTDSPPIRYIASGSLNDKEKETARSSGARGVYQKPIEVMDVMAQLEKDAASIRTPHQ